MIKRIVKITALSLAVFLVITAITIFAFAAYTRTKSAAIKAEQHATYENFLLELNNKKGSKELAKLAKNGNYGVGGLSITINHPNNEAEYKKFMTGDSL